MPIQQFQIRCLVDCSCIRRDFHRISVALIQHDRAHLFSENLWKKQQDIPHRLVQCLCLISQNRHPARKQCVQDHVLEIGIVLHLINHQMFDVAVFIFPFQTIFQIQHRKYIFIFQNPPLIRNIRKFLIPAFFHKPVINHIEILCYIHTIEFSLQDFLFFL